MGDLGGKLREERAVKRTGNYRNIDNLSGHCDKESFSVVQFISILRAV